MFDLNTASVAELMKQFPELGKFRAEDIVAWREENGPFASAEPLTAELGFPKSLAVQIGASIRVPETAEPAAAAESEPKRELETQAISEAEPVAALVADAPVADAPVADAPAPEAERAELSPEPGSPVFTTDDAAPLVDTSPDDAAPVFDISAEATLVTSTSMPAASPEAAIAVSQEAPVLPPPLPSLVETQEPPVAKPSAAAAPPGRARAPRWVVAAIVVSNAALAGGLLGLRREEHQARAPVAAMSVEVQALASQQSETRAKLEDTRHRLDQQADALAKTMETVAANEEQRKQGERAAAEQSARHAKDMAALAARVNRVERTVEDDLYTVEEAIRIIQTVRPAAAALAPSGGREDAKPKAEVKPPREVKPPHE